jgi:pimeloyl-ACP methyl ester carboxylesterase
MQVTPHTVRVRDIDVSVVRVGAGRPLVVCGGPQLGHHYLRRLDVLADAYELIYFDARGSGHTEMGDPSELSFAGATADLDSIRAALGIERITVLGHSLGGHVAYLFASMHPERIDALVLVDVGSPFAEDQARELGRAMVSVRTSGDDTKLREIQESAAFQRREPKAVEEYVLNILRPVLPGSRSFSPPPSRAPSSRCYRARAISRSSRILTTSRVQSDRSCRG